MKKLVLALSVFIFLVSALALFTGWLWARFLVADSVKEVVGAPVLAMTVSLHPGSAEARISGLHFGNPQGFREETLALVPNLSIRYDAGALLRGEVSIVELKVHVKRIVIEKNARNMINLLEIGAIRSRFQEIGDQVSPQPSRKGKVRIERAHLRIDGGTVTDYSQGGEPLAREFSVEGEEITLNHLTDPRQVVQFVVLVSILKAGLRSLQPDPARLPAGLRMQGNSLLEQVKLLFDQSDENLQKLLQSQD